MGKSNKKEKSENPKVYSIQFDDGSYLVLNSNAKDEKDAFKSTVRLDKCTLINESLLLEVERMIDSYSGRLYVSNNVFERQFKTVEKIITYELSKVNEVDY